MNVLHVIPAVSERYGGPSQAVFDMCRALSAVGVTTQVATTDADGSGRLAVPIGEPTLHEGQSVIFFPRQYSEAYKYSRPLRRWLFEHVGGFDVVHIHAVYSHASVAAAAAARAQGVPYIVRPLGSLSPWSLRNKAIRKLIAWRLGVGAMLSGANAIHCTSDAEARDLDALALTDKALVIPLGVATEPDEAAPGASQTNRYVLALGRIHPKKALDLLIRSFAHTVANGAKADDWRLLIAGTGDSGYVRELQRLAESCGCADRIQFLGWISGAERESVLRRAAILAMPSYQENFGLAAFEAMARRVPVVVNTATDYAADIAAARAGWTAEADERQLGAALAEAMRDEAERARRGDAGLRLVLQRFTWEHVAQQMKGAYARLAACSPR